VTQRKPKYTDSGRIFLYTEKQVIFNFRRNKSVLKQKLEFQEYNSCRETINTIQFLINGESFFNYVPLQTMVQHPETKF
jgi:hypothetical protein